jgi:hypothetical protein
LREFEKTIASHGLGSASRERYRPLESLASRSDKAKYNADTDQDLECAP